MKTRTKVALWLLAFFGPVWWVVPVGLRGREATISEKTTRITSPLTKEGLPDYAAWLNAKYGKGVTAENNAAAVLVDAWEEEVRKDWDEETKKEAHKNNAGFRRRLGVGGRPKELAWMESSFSSWAERQPANRLKEKALREVDPKATMPEDPLLNGLMNAISPDGKYRPPSALVQAAMDIEEKCGKRPWTTVEHPDVAAWLESQKPFVDMARAATREPRFFVPMADVMDGLSKRATWLNQQKQVDNLCAMDALHEAGEGRFEEALEDVRAIQGLARLQNQDGMTLLDMLMASGQEAQGDIVLVKVVQHMPKGHPAWSAAERMAGLPCSDLAVSRLRAVGVERYLGLGNMLRLRTAPPLPPRESPIPLLRMLQRSEVSTAQMLREMDMDPFLVRINERYDQWLAHPEKGARKRESSLLDVSSLIPPGLRRHLLAERLGDEVFDQLCILWTSLSLHFDVFTATHAHLPTTLALAKYRLDHARYPATLQELVPAYLAQLPESKHDFGTITYRTAGDGQAFSIAYVKPEDWQDGKPTSDARYREMLASPDFETLDETDRERAK